MKKTGFLGFILLIIFITFVSCDFFYFDNPFAAASNDGVGTSQPGDVQRMGFSFINTLTLNQNYYPANQNIIYCPGKSPISGSLNGFWISENEITKEIFHTVVCHSVSEGYLFFGGLTYTTLGQLANILSVEPLSEPINAMMLENIVAWCNLLSELTGYDPVYLFDSGDIIRDASTLNISDVRIDESANGFRLPTIDEWQIAASYIDGYIWTNYDWAAGANDIVTNSGELDRVAVSSGALANVKSKSSTSLGLYDMSGNLFELVAKNSTEILYTSSTVAYLGGAYDSLGGTGPIAYSIGRIVENTASSLPPNGGFRICRN